MASSSECYVTSCAKHVASRTEWRDILDDHDVLVSTHQFFDALESQIDGMLAMLACSLRVIGEHA